MLVFLCIPVNSCPIIQALHKERLADSDHTTLLLNCYTKLKDVNQLDKFIDRDVDFDVETAIRVNVGGWLFKLLCMMSRWKLHLGLNEPVSHFPFPLRSSGLQASELLQTCPSFGRQASKARVVLAHSA